MPLFTVLILTLPIIIGSNRPTAPNSVEKKEQRFPFMQPMSFDDFLVDLNQFYKGHEQVIDDDNSQGFWNPEELYDNTKKSSIAPSDVDSYKQDENDNESENYTRKKSSYLHNWNFKNIQTTVSHNAEKIMKHTTIPPLSEDIFETWALPPVIQTSTQNRNDKSNKIITILPIEDFLKIDQISGRSKNSKASESTTDRDQVKSTHISKIGRRRKRKKTDSEEVETKDESTEEEVTVEHSLYKWYKHLKETGKFDFSR